MQRISICIDFGKYIGRACAFSRGLLVGWLRAAHHQDLRRQHRSVLRGAEFHEPAPRHNHGRGVVRRRKIVRLGLSRRQHKGKQIKVRRSSLSISLLFEAVIDTFDIFKVWDGVSSQCVATFQQAHEGIEVCSVQFTRNGKYILSSGRDSMAKLWELSTVRCLVAYTGAGATGKQVKPLRHSVLHRNDP